MSTNDRPPENHGGSTDPLQRLNRGIDWARDTGRRNLTSLLESISEELRLIRKQVDSQSSGPDPDELESEVSSLGNEIYVLQRQIGDLEARLDSLHSYIDAVRGRLDDVEDDVDSARSGAGMVDDKIGMAIDGLRSELRSTESRLSRASKAKPKAQAKHKH